ncbi:MAG: hypothetical protein KY455_00345 [Euryarchaeota archaeon]|nr:hypothetical protein [Euryarchaeota archaeon]
MRTMLPSILTIAAILVLSTGSVAVEQENRELDVTATGAAESRETGEAFDLDVDVSGDVVVTSSGAGVDRAAYTLGPAVTATITVDGTSYAIEANIAGEGVSLAQTGVNADAWRLSAQGTTFGEGAQFRGSLTLLGTDEGYTVSGDGVLTVHSGEDTADYDLTYTGEGTFE